MSDWRAWGTERLDKFESALNPANLVQTLESHFE